MNKEAKKTSRKHPNVPTPCSVISKVFANKEKGVTAVLFSDGTRVKVRKAPNDVWNLSTAVAYAVAKKALGGSLKALDEAVGKCETKEKVALSEILKTEEVVIHCDSEEKAKALLGRLDELGCRWRDGDSLIKRIPFFFKRFGEFTCYHLRNKEMVGFGSLDFFQSDVCRIYEFGDVDLSK